LAGHRALKLCFGLRHSRPRPPKRSFGEVRSQAELGTEDEFRAAAFFSSSHGISGATGGSSASALRRVPLAARPPVLFSSVFFSAGWPGQLVVPAAQQQEAAQQPERSRPIASCRFATRTTSCPGHPSKRRRIRPS